MARIKYNADMMQYIALFESLTGAKVKDCIADGTLIFVVHENEMGKAIGKHGANIKKAGSILNKKIRVIEFSNDVCRFVRNIIYPTEAEVDEEEGIINIHGNDTKTKGMLIGRDRSNIKLINDIVKRYFNVQEVKVV